MGNFNRLPPELRALVVESLVDHWRYGDEREPTSIAPYASVCKEWQAIIERHNFSFLRVMQNSLDQFESSVVGSRRSILTMIILDVTLPTYDNDPCEKKETWEDKADNNRCFTKAVYGLFRILSTWFLEEAHRDGIDLILHISSPSDLRNANFELWQRRRWNIRDIGEKRFSDSWIDFVGHDEVFGRTNYLPRVQVIRSFQASPNNHRALIPAAHADIVAKLSGLREATFDIIKDKKKETRKIHFNQFAGSMTQWPCTLETLEIMSNTISSWRQIPHEALAEADCGAKLCESLRLTARGLKNLRIANVVRIREFLRPYWPQGSDDHEPFLPGRHDRLDFWGLETLHISYGSIWYNTEWHKQGDDINESSELVDFRQNISLAAARMVYTMPAIKHLTIKQRQLMYAGKHDLEYRVNKTSATITWTSSFDFNPWERTVEAWTEVARRHNRPLTTRIVTDPRWSVDGRAPNMPSLTF
ncbi:oxoglutarate iron-dependent oxygenase [Colletotrichum musicola]|uniref:Oxoglutarate iron-dependent oxygenase n=1 Tax=Colletotrichum musicola TaxID=2175873 RepID=A0A8H6UAH9_9PEZI|nr:oxoglutarate iron-dependent oxygenase [Colletotrichum musicola]